jgi:catecholate siderophore receptor
MTGWSARAYIARHFSMTITIKSRKYAVPRTSSASTLTAAALLSSLTLASPAAIAGEAEQTATLDKIDVHGVAGYKRDRLATAKFTESLHNTPQTIQIIDDELFQQQGATTLTEALRNSPGVGTFYAGENGSTSTGDSIYMRGFDSSSSIFVDGIRDLGSISRDVFNVEQIEVEKGPAGTDNGRSAPTGAINLVSKQAGMNDFVAGSVSAGNDGQKRTTADINHAFAGLPGSALRVNALWQDSDVAGRDHVNNQRWGLAPSLAFGLGSDTRYFLDLLYVKQDNVPDGGVPTIGLPGWQPQTGLEALAGHPVNPENFYGTRADHDDVTAKMATFRFEHDFSDRVKLTNTTRWGRSEQDYLLTAFMGTSSNISASDSSDLSTYTLARSLPTFKDQQNTIITDQLNLRADFTTGTIEHRLSTGLELTRETQKTHGISSTGAWTDANLYAPNWNTSGLSWQANSAGSDGRTDTAALYAFDTMHFGERLLLSAGLRVDRYKTSYENTAVCNNQSGRRGVSCNGASVGSVVQTADLESKDTLLNWKIGAVYKANDSVSIYTNYALSQQPPGGNNFQLSSSANAASNPSMDPQLARTFEIGSKWSLLNDALALNMALFRTNVSNEIAQGSDGLYYQTGKKRVEGAELSVVGNLTDNWSIAAGYTRMNTEVVEGTAVAQDGSSNLTYTPDQAFSSWTSYRLPFDLTIGGGVRYSGQMHRGSDGAAGTPTFTKSYTVWDAMLSYPVNSHLALRLNAYNVFDKRYVAAINKSGYRYTPGTPRTFLLSADYRF